MVTENETNVGDPERWLSVIAGSAIAAYGLTRRSVSGAVVAVLGGALVWRGTSGHCVVYQALGLNSCGEQQDRQVSVPYGKGVGVEKSVTIDAPPDKLWAFWRNFENLPQFMHNLESVTPLRDNRTRWVAKGPAGTKVDWEAEIINEIPHELIAWRSVAGSKVDNAGSVHFAPATGGRGTEVKVHLRYDPPAGVVGAAISKLFGEDPAVNIQEDLRRFKMLMETGELATTSGQATGRKA